MKNLNINLQKQILKWTHGILTVKNIEIKDNVVRVTYSDDTMKCFTLRGKFIG